MLCICICTHMNILSSIADFCQRQTLFPLVCMCHSDARCWILSSECQVYTTDLEVVFFVWLQPSR